MAGSKKKTDAPAAAASKAPAQRKLDAKGPEARAPTKSKKGGK